MIISDMIDESFEQKDKRNFINAKRKIDRKIVSIHLLIDDCKCSKKYKEELVKYLKESVII